MRIRRRTIKGVIIENAEIIKENFHTVWVRLLNGNIIKRYWTDILDDLPKAKVSEPVIVEKPRPSILKRFWWVLIAIALVITLLCLQGCWFILIPNPIYNPQGVVGK